MKADRACFEELREQIQRVREVAQLALDESYHAPFCPKSRRSARPCECGWDRVRERIETVLRETL